MLLPTRNGGPYLDECIRSVLVDPSPDLELVVSDNANDDSTPQVLDSFAADPRLRVLRQPQVISVVENWNRALEAATGDYLLMIGDDDLLLRSCVPTIRELVERFDEPDCITYNAFSFVSPASFEAEDGDAHFSESHFLFDSGFRSGQLLTAEQRRQIVVDYFRFLPRLPLNMQTTVVARKALYRLNPPVFRAPFPDHIALCGLLLTAERWLYSDTRPLIIGVSPKSFGHYVYSGEHASGLDYLGVDTSFPGALPGNPLVNGMHQWLTVVATLYRDHLSGVQVSRRDYVARQLWAWYVQTRQGRLGYAEFTRHLRLLGLRDWLRLVGIAFDPTFVRQAAKRVRSRRGTDLVWPRLERLAGVATIEQFRDFIEARQHDDSERN
ncbi:MAG TPA: glycosyltransferase family A protein [Acidimicrobiia bacterium]|nr:glycosyltransferase family A protein [Acidimicrobiia bacterium]